MVALLGRLAHAVSSVIDPLTTSFVLVIVLVLDASAGGFRGRGSVRAARATASVDRTARTEPRPPSFPVHWTTTPAAGSRLSKSTTMADFVSELQTQDTSSQG